MLPSPITVTIAGTAHALNRINQDKNASTFFKKAENLEVKLEIRHSYESKDAKGNQMERHNIDLSVTTFSATADPQVTQVYSVVRCKRGTAPTAAVDALKALNVLSTAQADNLLAWLV